MRIVHAALFALLIFFPFGTTYADRLVLVAGGGKGGDGPAKKARLIAPFGVDFDKHGNMYIVELRGNRVHKVTPKGMLTTIGGTGEKGDSGDGGPAAMATFNGAHSLAIGPEGHLYIADTWNNRVRRIDLKTKKVTRFAGVPGKKAYGGDGGPAAKAKFSGIYSIAFNPSKSKMYLADLNNRRVRMVDMKTKIVTTIAGNGKRGVPTDGADAKTSPLVDPRAVAADSQGNVYILERSGHALRVVDSEGKIRTVVGAGKAGNSGDGGDPRKARLRGPKHLCIDHDDNVIIADTANHVIRVYYPRENKLVRIAGTGKKGFSGKGGEALKVPMSQPHGVTIHKDGTLYIVDSFNDRVFRLVKETGNRE
ncbi:MAG: hypothetical protein ACFCD0_05190 [Gemmataceae bacterium]